jgi:hypothetical protein
MAVRTGVHRDGRDFVYQLRSYEAYKEFVREFYEQRDRLGDAAAQDDNWAVTDEEFRASVSEAVTYFQQWKQRHGRLQFEYLARIYIVDNEAVMQHLAPAVEQCEGDAYAIAAAITPVLLSLVASGAVSYPADALTFASAALALAERRTELL